MLLSIVVLSYNRPKQVQRILENFLGVPSGDYNIIIKDDLSPLCPEITEVVSACSDRLDVDVILHVNENNMGYDMNLIDSFNIVDSEYVFLLSDDDYIDGGRLNSLLEILENREFDFYFTPYFDNGVVKRSAIPVYDDNKFSDVIYNSVLFSGLIFRRKAVSKLKLDLSFLSSCIYSQVYIASLLIYKERAFGVMPSMILHLGGDGENYFGKNSSAKNSSLLSERKKITSNLNYQIFLLRVVDEIAKSTSVSIKINFMREYRRRLIGYGFKARSSGILNYLDFIRTYCTNGIRVDFVVFVFFLVIVIVPASISERIYATGINFLRKSG